MNGDLELTAQWNKDEGTGTDNPTTSDSGTQTDTSTGTDTGTQTDNTGTGTDTGTQTEGTGTDTDNHNTTNNDNSHNPTNDGNTDHKNDNTNTDKGAQIGQKDLPSTGDNLFGTPPWAGYVLLSLVLGAFGVSSAVRAYQQR